MQFLVPGIESIVEKLYFCIAVTIDAPSHAQVRNLPDPVHGFNGSVAGSTFNPGYGYMLGMTEEGVILKVVDPDPFDGSPVFIGFYDLVDLVSSRISSFPDQGVTVPAYVYLRNPRRFGMVHCRMTILAIYLIICHMYHM
jgi:hypothetical protein